MATTDKVRIGVIGVGQIGKLHLENYQKIDSVEVVAVTDADLGEAGRVRERFGIADLCPDARGLLARDDIDAVDVCLHNNLHMPYTCAALEAGKHVYCEKPMAGAYCDAETMLNTAKKTGKMLAIQLATLFSLETRAARALIEAGRLGKVFHARSTGFRRRNRPYVDGYGTMRFVQKDISAGGALFDMGVYHIANMLHLLGNPAVRTITGAACQETGMDERRRQASGYNVEELGLGFVRFENNATLDIIESWAVHLGGFEGSSIVGSEGGVRLNPFSYHFNIDDLEFDATADLQIFEYRRHHVHEDGGVYDSPQHHWAAALQGRVELLPTAELALNTMLISEGVYLSNQLGREVSPDEVRAASKSTALPFV